MDGDDRVFDDRTPGVEEYEPTANYLSYTAGLGLADPADDRFVRRRRRRICCGPRAYRSG